MDVFCCTTSSPRIHAWPFTSGVGYGVKYANPATLIAGEGLGVDITPSNDAIAIASVASPHIHAYPWTVGVGYGTKYSNPATAAPFLGRRARFSKDGNYLAVASIVTSPFVAVYNWSSSGFGTKFANPGVAVATDGWGVDWHPNTSDIAISSNASPRINTYPWSGAGFGAKYSNPATIIGSGPAYDVSFSNAGNDMIISHSQASSTCISAYPFTSGVGYGTMYSSPSSSLTNGQGGKFHPNDTAVSLGTQDSPFVNIWAWSGAGFGTKYSNPATLPGGFASDSAFTTSGSDIAWAHQVSSPTFSTYPFDETTGFGVVYTAPGTPPSLEGRGVVFTNVTSVVSTPSKLMMLGVT